MTLWALPGGLLAFSDMGVSEGRKGRGLVQRHESLHEPLEIEQYQLYIRAYKATKIIGCSVGTTLVLLSVENEILYPATRRPESTEHCMLLSRSSRGLRKTLTTVHLPKPRFEGSNLRYLHLHLHAQVQHCQYQHIYQALLYKRPSSASQNLNPSQSFYSSIPFRRKSITTMAAADRNVLPDTYVLATIAGGFH